MRCWPRSPWYQARTRTIGRPIRSASSATCRSCSRPVVGVADVLKALQEPPGARDVDHPPLHHLAAAQPGPGALGSTLCRRVGHSAAPMSPECSGIRSGCGCERARAAAQALFTARPVASGCHIGCLDKVLRRARSPHQRGAPRSGGRREPARVGELGIWKPGILPRVAAFQVPRISAFQFFARARGLGRRDRGRGRVGARFGPACPPEWPRRAGSWGGDGLPHGPAPRVPRGEREVRSERRSGVSRGCTRLTCCSNGRTRGIWEAACSSNAASECHSWRRTQSSASDSERPRSGPSRCA